jgi:hypothetical protein
MKYTQKACFDKLFWATKILVSMKQDSLFCFVCHIVPNHGASCYALGILGKALDE